MSHGLHSGPALPRERLEASFAGAAEGGGEELEPGLHGPRLLRGSRGSVHLLRVRTRRTGDHLDAAGAPTTPLAAILPA